MTPTIGYFSDGSALYMWCVLGMVCFFCFFFIVWNYDYWWNILVFKKVREEEFSCEVYIYVYTLRWPVKWRIYKYVLFYSYTHIYIFIYMFVYMLLTMIYED